MKAAKYAENVLRSMGALYAAMTSYSDSGEVSTTFAEAGNRMRIPFTTLYQKPSLLRFECFRPHPYAPLSHIVTQYVVGFDGSTAYSRRKKYNESETSTSMESLSFAIAAAVPSSKGAAITVSRLLIPEIHGLSILDLLNPTIRNDDHIDGVSCNVISAQYPSGENCELWVEKDTLILRKLVQSNGRTCSEEVRENIRVNDAIDVGVFAADLRANDYS